MSEFRPISDRVRLLKREAIRYDPQTYRARGEWLKEKVVACKDNPRSLDDLRELVQRLPWSYQPTVIDLFLEEDGGTEEFDAVGIETPIEQARKRWPIREYCEEILALRFKHRKCKCPLHNGDSETSFVIDEESGDWFCFGHCPADPGKNYRRGDVVDLHRIVNQFESELEASKDLLSAKPKTHRLEPGQHSFLPVKRKVENKAEKKLLARVLASSSQVTDDLIRQASSLKSPSAVDFGDWLLRQSVTGHLIVARSKYEALVGRRARRAISTAADRLQYLCCSTAKTESRHKTEENLNVQSPLFLNLEFDKASSENQLKILWWLKTVRKWNLISITWSGGKSWHGLFDVREVETDRLTRMRDLAQRLGACPKSLTATAWVRFPGGRRTDEEWQQKPIARQEIIYFRD
jgi:hypothetical protein